MSKQTCFRKDTAELLLRDAKKKYGFLGDRLGYDEIILELRNFAIRNGWLDGNKEKSD